MRGRWIVAGMVAVAACGPGGVTPKQAAPTPDDGPTRYEASTTVLESKDHGPELCLGVMLTSYPPQCGDVPVTNWSWDRVEGETRAVETIWGEYRVVGTFDGKTFTLTETPGPPAREDTEPPAIKPACPEPPGGWERPEPSKTGEAAFQAAVAAAQREKDFAALWIVDPNPPSEGEVQDMTRIILNVAFTGDPSRHTTELREVWGGALCVATHEHTRADLERITTEAHDFLRERGLMVLSFGPEEVSDTIEMTVVAFSAEDKEALDARFGKGLIQLSARLHPVS